MRTTFVTCREHNSCVAILSVDPSAGAHEIAPPAWVEPWINAQEGALVAIGHAPAVQTKHGLLTEPKRRWWQRKRRA